MLTSHLHQIIIDVIGQCLKRIEFYFLSQGRLLKFAHALSRCSSNHALRTSLDCKKPLVNGSLEYSYMSEASREQDNNSNLRCVANPNYGTLLLRDCVGARNKFDAAAAAVRPTAPNGGASFCAGRPNGAQTLSNVRFWG